MPKRTSRRNFQTLRKYKRPRKHNASVTQNTSAQDKQRVKLALIAEVKKYPIICTSLGVDEGSETCYGAWEKIAEQLQIDECTSISPMDCIKMWKNIKRSFMSYIKDDIYTRGPIIRAMQCLFPDFNEENLLPGEVEVLDENDAQSNTSGVGSDTAEEIMRPKTNRTAIITTLREPPEELRLALIQEVKKYPPLWTSLDVDADSETFYGAWEKIAEALQIDDSISTSPVDYCRKTWKIIKIILDWYIKGDRVCTDDIQAMLDLFPECREMMGRGRRQAVVKYVDDSAGLIDEDADESESNHSSDETYESNNSSKVGSVTAESEHEIMRPTTNNVAPLKEKLLFITKQLVEFTCPDGRSPILAFMEKPSKELYPDYYNVIDKPIDVITIEANIKNDRYNSMEEMISDYRLMFSNCRVFNEDGCMIYEDACLLERVMNEKLEELNCSYTRNKKTPSKVIEECRRVVIVVFPPKSPSDFVVNLTHGVGEYSRYLDTRQQAATPGNPRSVGARSTEQAVSLAIVEHLFDSLRSPAAKTDVCNMLIQTLHKYRPNLISEIIEYGASQQDFFNVDWSGLPIPDDLCHEIWRRDLQKNVSKFYKNNSSKRRAKKGN